MHGGWKWLAFWQAGHGRVPHSEQATHFRFVGILIFFFIPSHSIDFLPDLAEVCLFGGFPQGISQNLYVLQPNSQNFCVLQLNWLKLMDRLIYVTWDHISGSCQVLGEKPEFLTKIGCFGRVLDRFWVWSRIILGFWSKIFWHSGVRSSWSWEIMLRSSMVSRLWPPGQFWSEIRSHTWSILHHL